ncbi:nucleoside hydrolase [soil metagenome]
MTYRPLYFDCDTGIDDSLALAYLLASPEIELVGVGTVSGNIDAEQAAVNTLDLIALAGRTGVPVALGAHDHLARPYDGGVPHIHGRNGVGNIELPTSGTSTVAETAAEMIVRLSHEHAGELELVAVGPLTNLAIALALDPSIVERIRAVTIMGGAAYASGNISPVAEANIYNDAEAAALVLAARWPVVLVPLDVTIENTLEEEDRHALLDSGRPMAVALGEMLDLYFGFYVDFYGRRSCSLHDPLAAAIAVGGIVATNAPAVSVVVDASTGPGRGQTICDLRDQRLGARDQPGATVRVVLDTDVPLAPHLMERLLSL